MPATIALELAKAKALEVSADRPDDWVIGSDSVVSVAGRLFDKPADRAQAAEHLRFFSGKPMELTSAVALARGGSIEWSHCDSAMLARARAVGRLHRILSRRRMAGGVLLRRRVPD